MKRYFLAMLVGILMVVMLVGVVAADVNPVTPSTNEINKTIPWAHFNVLDTDFGELEVEFVQPRAFYACFEYRTDGDTSQATGDPNYNEDITDGLYPYVCLSTAGTSNITIQANEYVEIRHVFGGERDERFDWTRVDVLGKDDCKNGGWEALGYRNQGLCIKDYNN